MQGLDTLRAAAVLAVMFYHLTIFGELPFSWLPVTYYGWMGVDLFFVLSGFLIGQQLFQKYRDGAKPSAVDFYLRRAFRILPAYFAVLALYFLAPAWRESPRIGPLWKFLTFTMNFGFSFDTRAFSHAWSLCVEEHFYLLLPLLAMLLMRRPSLRKTIAVIVCVTAFGIGLRAWLLARYPDDVWTAIYYPTYTRLDGLVAGISLALIKVFREQWWQRLMRHGHLLIGAAAVLVGSMVWMVRERNLGDDVGSARWAIVIGFPLLSAGLALMTASAMSERGWLARWRVPGAQWIAALAFSLYLTHKEVGHLVHERFRAIADAQGPASWALYAVACLAAAVLLHLLVERPFLALRGRVMRRRVTVEKIAA